MHQICKKAGVKPFGFHAIRHKSAAITFSSNGLDAAQVLMGHSRASTTDLYTKSAGLCMDHMAIMDALGKSRIGQSVGALLMTNLSSGTKKPLEKNCNHEHVTQ